MPPKSPIKSCSERMKWLFGPPRTTFEPKILPSELEVIQVWMSCFDKTASESGKKILSASAKSGVINDMIDNLTGHMKDLDENIELMDKKVLTTKVRRLVTRAEKLVRENRAKMDDGFWISTTAQEYSKIFDISAVTKSDTPLSPKRKLNDEDLFPVSV